MSKIDHYSEILIRIEFSQVNFKYNNTVRSKSLTVTDHGLAMRVLVPSLQRAPEMKR